MRAGDGRVHGIYSSTDVANLILKTTGTALMDKKKLHKLLYYMQGWTLAALGRPAFANDLQAWVDGPVSVGMRRDTHYATCFEVANRPLSNPLAPQDRDLLALMYLIAPFTLNSRRRHSLIPLTQRPPGLTLVVGYPPPMPIPARRSLTTHCTATFHSTPASWV